METDRLPEGWEVRQLGEVAEVFSGSSAPQGQHYFENGKYPFVRVHDLACYGRTKNLTKIKDKVNDLAIKKQRLKSTLRGTILFPKSGAAILTNNRAMLGIDAYIVSHLAGVKANSSIILADFLYYWLCQLKVDKFVENEAYPSLRLSKIRQFEVPLPPPSEQHRIVARIEELTRRIEEAKGLRLAAQKETESIMPSALHEVFSQGEREGWDFRPLCEVGKIMNGFGFPLKYQGNMEAGYPFIKVSDMNLLGNEIYIYKAMNTVDDKMLKEIKAKVYPAGTIIFPKIGMAIATNKKRILAVEATFDNNIMGILLGSSLDPKWAYYFLSNIDLMMLSETTTMPSIRKSRVADLRFPLPPLSEQHHIVAYLDRLQARVSELRRLQQETQKEIDSITSTVLDKAFRGEL